MNVYFCLFSYIFKALISPHLIQNFHFKMWHERMFWEAVAKNPLRHSENMRNSTQTVSQNQETLDLWGGTVACCTTMLPTFRI